jgi:phage shock protein PspC (stress-responsive transcriptional regulator)
MRVMSTTAPWSSAPRLERLREGRMVAGVSAGIARHLHIDPILVRLGFVVAAVAGGIGFAAYLAAYLLIPEEGADQPLYRRLGSHQAATLAGVALLVIAAISTIDVFDGDGIAGSIVWACVLAGAGGFLLLRAQGDTASVAADETRVAAPASARRFRPTQAVGGLLLLVAAGVAAAAAAGADVGWQEGAAIALIAAGGVLVAGAFVGASPWLALPPLLIAASIASLVAAGAAIDGPIGKRDFTPVRGTQLPDEYRLAIGELNVDLRKLDLPEGRTHVKVRVGIGEAHVIVPAGVALELSGHAGAGDVHLPGGHSDGTDVDREETIAAPGRPILDLDVSAGLGSVRVERES